MNPGGSIFIELNQQKYNQSTYLGFDKNLMLTCKDLGAEIDLERGIINFQDLKNNIFKKK
jgi:hypothetical protein